MPHATNMKKRVRDRDPTRNDRHLPAVIPADRDGQVRILVHHFSASEEEAENAIDAAIWRAHQRGYHAPISEAVSMLDSKSWVQTILDAKRSAMQTPNRASDVSS